ncbi:MAG: hypothetical protein RSC93_07785 [Erysipelotrichaceae bacterium]
MVEFTAAEVIVLVISFGLVLCFIGCLFKGFFRIATTIFLSALLFGFGFFWLPSQIDQVKNGTKTKEDVINETFTKETVDSSLASSKKYYEEHKGGITGIVESAFEKVGKVINGENKIKED